LGYLGLPVCFVLTVLQLKSVVPPRDEGRWLWHWSPPPVAVVGSATAVGIWLALGLRADDRDDECADLVVEEEAHLWSWVGLGKETWVSVWRISTTTIILGIVALALAAWRVWHPE